MTREKTGNDILDRLYKKYDDLTEQFRELGKENGWCDEDGYLDPLMRSVCGEATELEEKRIDSKEDLSISIKLLEITIERNKLEKQIREIEAQSKKTEM